MSITLQQAFEVCKKITDFHAKSFAFATKKLPPDLAKDVYAVYAFCRITDDIVDEQTHLEPAAIAHDLVAWKELFLDATNANIKTFYADNNTNDFCEDIRTWFTMLSVRQCVVTAYADVIRRRKLFIQYPLDLIHGVGLDLLSNRLQTFHQLEEYCHFVAGVPGLMMADLFEITDKQTLFFADTLGKAMQLTNILRDIGQDMDRNRLYIPLDDLAAFNLDIETIQKKQITPELKKLIKHYSILSRKWYSEGRKGIRALPKDIQVSIRSAARIYEKILDQIEKQDYDIFKQRAYTSKSSKIRSFARISILHFFTRFLG